ncbi:MAG: glycolate oxidase iron-sulfur subunit [Pseudomonadota bacterium]|jgi:glycolate oxidase iron-sulfur subunit
MQTNFTKKQLEDPRIAEADAILRRCVHCGLCTATCPTYLLLGDERDSPRGRIYLIKDMLEGAGPAHVETSQHIDRCLSCLSCMSTCPGGVDYMHLVDIARTHIEETRPRSPVPRMVRRALAAVLPFPRRTRWALRAAAIARPFAAFVRRLGLKEAAAMLALAPRKLGTAKYSGAGTAATSGARRGRVILLAGCVQQVLRPEINDSTIRLLARSGYDVEVAGGAGCCGALVQHMGREADAHQFARRNIDAWSRLISRGPVDAIIVNASGCGTVVKDYGHMFRNDPEYRTKAEVVSSKARDISEFLAEVDPGPPRRWSSIRVAYHDACSLRHGQRIVDEPRALLSTAGFTVVDIPESHICCGSAGTYNILQPELATELRDRKVANIEAQRPDIIACGNIGCMTQIAAGTDIPIAHTVELLDWAYGGPVPVGLSGIEAYSNEVPGPPPVAKWAIDQKFKVKERELPPQ